MWCNGLGEEKRGMDISLTDQLSHTAVGIHVILLVLLQLKASIPGVLAIPRLWIYRVGPRLFLSLLGVAHLGYAVGCYSDAR